MILNLNLKHSNKTLECLSRKEGTMLINKWNASNFTFISFDMNVKLNFEITENISIDTDVFNQVPDMYVTVYDGTVYDIYSTGKNTFTVKEVVDYDEQTIVYGVYIYCSKCFKLLRKYELID